MSLPLLDDLKQKNRAWAARMLAEDPDFFRRLAAQQAPQLLWIGCSDSRVPANTARSKALVAARGPPRGEAIAPRRHQSQDREGSRS